jgi:hypothetical protein
VKKQGEWIATFGPSLRVSRVSVEASPALDLVEVRTVWPDLETTNIMFFDRLEGARLRDVLCSALDQLEEGAINAAVPAGAAPAPRPRYVPGYVDRPDAKREWMVLDAENGNSVVSGQWLGAEAEASARARADYLNAEWETQKGEGDPQRAPVPGR